MKIQTMSVVVGTNACNASCKFCVSRQTPKHDMPTTPNWRNFMNALMLADKAGATTILLTGKGEPTMYPNLIAEYLKRIMYSKFQFPFIELQTNGIAIGNGDLQGENEDMDFSYNYLKDWYDLGLTTVCLSAVETGYANKDIYSKDYPAIEQTAAILNEIGFTVRLSLMMMKRYISRPCDIDRVTDFCKKNKIKQLTLRPIAYPDNSDNDVSRWTKDHTLSDTELKNIVEYIKKNGTPILKLAPGATVYDYNGQNLCLANCLTTDTTDDNMRQIIFYPDGSLRYSWVYDGAVLL